MGVALPRAAQAAHPDAVEQPQVLEKLVDGVVWPTVEQARGASGAMPPMKPGFRFLFV